MKTITKGIQGLKKDFTIKINMLNILNLNHHKLIKNQVTTAICSTGDPSIKTLIKDLL